MFSPVTVNLHYQCIGLLTRYFSNTSRCPKAKGICRVKVVRKYSPWLEVFLQKLSFSVFTGNCQPALSMHRIIDKVFMMYSRLAGLETLDNAMPKSLMNPPDIRHHGHTQNAE